MAQLIQKPTVSQIIHTPVTACFRFRTKLQKKAKENNRQIWLGQPQPNTGSKIPKAFRSHFEHNKISEVVRRPLRRSKRPEQKLYMNVRWPNRYWIKWHKGGNWRTNRSRTAVSVTSWNIHATKLYWSTMKWKMQKSLKDGMTIPMGYMTTQNLWISIWSSWNPLLKAVFYKLSMTQSRRQSWRNQPALISSLKDTLYWGMVGRFHMNQSTKYQNVAYSVMVEGITARNSAQEACSKRMWRP